MEIRRKLIPIAALTAAVAASASGAAVAADSGGAKAGGPTAKPTDPGIVKCVGDTGGKKEVQGPDLKKVAADLGVSVDQLTNALGQTKQWIGSTGTTPTPQAFAGHVAALLNLSADKVLAEFTSTGLIGTPASGEKSDAQK